MPEILPPPIEDAPVTPEPVEQPEITEEQKQSDSEWDAALSEVSGKEVVEEKPAEEPVVEAPAAPVEEAPIVEEKPAEAPEPTVDVESLNQAAARIQQRQSAASIQEIKSEVHKSLSTDIEPLKDSLGVEITSAKDLENVENPNTPGVAFTPEDAQKVFSNYTQTRDAKVKELDSYATKVAEASQAVEDEAKIVQAAFKDVLEQNPAVQKSLYEQFMKTVKRDKTGNFIEEAPVSLMEFYSTALAPYAAQLEAQKTQEAAPAPQDVAPAAPPAPKKVDKSDIYRPSTNPLSKDDQEWAEAYKEL